MKIYNKFYGILDTYFEQGFGAPAATIWDNRPERKGSSPWDRTYVFGKKKNCWINIKKDGVEVYDGPWNFSRENTSLNNFLTSPKEIKASNWKKMFDGKHQVVFTEEVFVKSDKMIITSFLDTDLYKLTMMQFAYHNSFNKSQQATYALKCRSGEKLGYLKEEIEEQIKYLKLLKFSEEEIDYLKSLDLFEKDFLTYLTFFSLKNVKFIVEDNKGDLSIRATGPWESSIIVEVPLLAIVQELHFSKTHKESHYQEARDRLKNKISLIKETDIKFTDFGTRRRYSKKWQQEVVETLKKEVPNNLMGTSNVLLAKKLGISPIGTMAHEFFQAFQVLGTSFETSQKEALYSWYKEYGDKLSVALTDILGTNIFLADCDKDLTEKYKGYRHDSGDPISWGYRMLAHFHEMSVDAKDKNLVFSDGLNIPLAIKIHNEFKNKTNVFFGIGTNLTNDFSSHKSISLVMKLVNMNGMPTIKVSDNPAKITCEDEKMKDKTLNYIKKVVKYPRINIAVDALIKNEKGEYLIIQRGDKSEAGYKKWAFPGGFLDYFETTEEGIVREVKEELGVDLKINKLKKVLQDPSRDPRGRIISLLYEGEVKGEITPNDEVLNFKWVKKIEDNMSFDHKEILEEVLNDGK